MDTKRVDLLKFCEGKLREIKSNITDLEIADDIEPLASRVKHQVEKKIISFREKGIPPNFEFDDCLTYMLCRCGSDTKTNDWIRNYRTQIRRAIKVINPTSFEYFCKHILECNGIASYVTQRARDGGVDFYGLLEMHNYVQTVFLRSVNLRIIGQAKRYSGNNKVGEGGIDEIRTKYSDFKHGHGRAFRILPDWFKKSNYPVILMVVATTGFTADAEKSAARDNVILRDGDQITEDIIHSPKAEEWFELDKHGNKRFRRELFFKSFVEQN
ncbi:MAG: restriction endonuclease [Planctomycetota bacterium]|nr:restriction endonuclease [Planctomycetota bacterium]